MDTVNQHLNGRSFFMKLVKFFAIAIFALPTLVMAGPTKDDVKMLVDNTIKYIETNGLEKAKTEIKNKDGQFIKGELYVFIIDFDGKMISHGAKASLDGKNLIKLRTPEGKYFIQEMIKVSKESGEGWVEYKWTHPLTGKVTPKASLAKKIPGKDMLVGAGLYLQ